MAAGVGDNGVVVGDGGGQQRQRGGEGQRRQQLLVLLVLPQLLQQQDQLHPHGGQPAAARALKAAIRQQRTQQGLVR